MQFYFTNLLNLGTLMFQGVGDQPSGALGVFVSIMNGFFSRISLFAFSPIQNLFCWYLWIPSLLQIQHGWLDSRNMQLQHLCFVINLDGGSEVSFITWVYVCLSLVLVFVLADMLPLVISVIYWRYQCICYLDPGRYFQVIIWYCEVKSSSYHGKWLYHELV